MPSSIPHQKFCFYHLPTRGRAGIKLGDAWYVSNVSIIFYCSMLYYILFWTLLGFIIHFYIIFGTNLLTGGPAQIAVFFAYFSVSQKRNIKRSPNGMKPSGELFLEQTWSRGLGVDVKKEARRPRGREVRLPPGRAPTLVGPLQLHRPTSSSYIYPYTPKTSRSTTKPYFHRRNLLYPRGAIFGPFPELRQGEHWSWRASTSTPWPLRWSVSSLFQTFRSIASS